MSIFYVFGNSFYEKDSVAERIAKKLGLNFILLTDPLEIAEKEPIILDACINSTKVEVINDLSLLETHKLFSLHDLDLAFYLKLMKNTGLIKNCTIICLPVSLDDSTILEQLKPIIEKIHKPKSAGALPNE